MEKAFISFLFCLTVVFSADAQYYYQDIYSTQQTNLGLQHFAKQGVKQLRIKSYDARHTLQDNFLCTRNFSKDYTRIVTKTGASMTGTSVTTAFFDAQRQVIRTVDSSIRSISITQYHYNNKGMPDSIVFASRSLADQDTFTLTETHVYQYDHAAHLQSMKRLKNNVLYSTILFQSDSLGRVIKESGMQKQDSLPAVYYKYDIAGKLTDVFHFDAQKQKMEPDYLFDYDNQGRIKEKTTVSMNTSNYLLWQYHYNEKDLIAGETCYGKSQTLQGTLEYEYLF